jgi:hypothetical protein
LGLGVKLLAELHDVNASLTKRRPYGRAGVCFSCTDLQLDISGYFLSHSLSPLGTSAKIVD